MARNDNVVGANFELDIANLKKGLKEAKQSISLTTSEFQKSTSGMNNWQKTAIGLSAKVSELTSNLEKQKKVVSNVEKQYELTKKQYGENSQEAQKLLTQLNKENATYNKIEKQLGNYKSKLDSVRASEESMTETLSKTSNVAEKATKEFKDTTKAMVDWKSNSDGLKAKLKQLNTIIPEQKNLVDKLAREYSDLVKQQDYSEEAAKSLKSEWQKQNGILKNLKTDVSKYENELDDLNGTNKSVKASTESLSGGFTVLKGAMAGLVADGIRAFARGMKSAVVTGVKFNAQMEQYNTSFEVMTGSAEKAAEVTKKLQEIGAKTPFEITDIAEATQLLMNYGFTADEAIDRMMMLGDISQGSSEKMNRIAMAYGQMSSAGKVSLEDVKQMIEAGFNPLNEISETTGETMASLYDRISKGTISVDEITASMQRSTAEGGKYFQSMEKQSKTLNGQLSTLKDTVQQKLGQAFSGLSDTITSEVLPSIISFIENVDMDEVAKEIKKATDNIITGFKWVIDNRKLVETSIKAMIAAFAVAKLNKWTTSLSKGYKIITSITKGVKLFTGVQKGMTASQIASTTATNAGTIATRLFNAAWKANPIGLVITGVTLLGAGIGALTKYIKNSTKETDKNVIATDKLVKKQKELTKELNENEKSRKNNINGAKEQTGTIDVLFKKLQELESVENKTNAQKSTMIRLVDELNTLMPELNLKYDDEKDKLNMSTEAIRSNIDAQRELILAKASQENLLKIAEDIAKQEIAYGDAVKQNTKNQKEYEKAKKELADFEKEHGKNIWNMNMDEIEQHSKLSKAVDKTKKSYEKSNETVKNGKKELSDLNKEYEKTTNYANKTLEKADIDKGLAKITEQAKQKGIEIPKAVSQGIKEGNYAIPETIDQLQALMNFDKSLQEAGLGGVKIPQYLSEGIINGKMSVQEAISQINKIVNFNKLVEEAESKGKIIPKKLADNLATGKINIQEANKQLISAINFNEGLAKAEKDSVAIPKKLADNMKNGKISVDEANAQLNAAIKFDEMVKKAEADGIKVPDNLATQIRNGKIKPQTAVNEMNALTSFNDVVTKANNAGINIPNSLQKGIDSGKTKPSEAVNRVKALISYQDAITKAGLEGVKIPTSLSNSVLSGKVSVEEANRIMNTWIDFKSAHAKSKNSGIKIPKELENGILSGKTSVDEANTQMNRWIKFQEAENKSGRSGKNIPKELQKGILNGKISVTDANNQMNRWIKFQAALDTSDQSGKKIPKNIQEGVLSGKYSVEQAMRMLNSGMDNEMNKQPPKARGKGSETGLSYAGGVGSQRGNVATSFDGLANNAVSKFDKTKEAEKYGSWTTGGYQSGASKKSKERGFWNTFANIGMTALNAINSVLNFGSPSKVTKKFGKWFVQGLEIGAKKEENNLFNQIKSMANQINKSFQSEIGLDKVKNSLNTSLAYTTSGNRASNNKPTTNVVNNFYQTNNSPRPLSRLEIYRQTHNLLNAKGGS